MVWGLCLLVQCQIYTYCPCKCTVNGPIMLIIFWLVLVNLPSRAKDLGTILQRKFCENMSTSIFQQDGAHTSKLSQNWCSSHLPDFWAKEVWPGNSPDLSPIENLWAYMKQELSKMKTPKNLKCSKIRSNLYGQESHKAYLRV